MRLVLITGGGMRRQIRLFGRVVICGAVTAAACQRGPVKADPAIGPLVTALSNRPPIAVRSLVRLSVPTDIERCAANPTAGAGSLTCTPSSGRADPDISAVAIGAARAIRSGIDVDALHAAALVALVFADTVGISLGQAISYLEMVTRLAPRSSSSFGDLAAAHLVAADRRSDPFELLLALDAATRAIEIDPANLAARFNRVLALDGLALTNQVAREWRAYTERDSTSAWVLEGRRRGLTGVWIVGAGASPTPDAPDDSLAAFSIQRPFEARALAWERLLGGWGSARMRNDSLRAARLLHAASVVGSALGAQFGDSSIAFAVRAIRQTREATRVDRVARLHARFAYAQARIQANDNRGADSAYVEVLTDPTTPTTLRQWAVYGHANAQTYLRRYPDVLSAADSLLQSIDQVHQPSLAGRSHWLMGMTRLRLLQNDLGLQSVHEARRAFERSGERENVQGAIGVEGELAFRSGNDAVGYERFRTALRGLREFPTSTWRHNVLFLLAGKATQAELDRAAEAIEAEDFATAEAGGRAVSVAEARLTRARALWASGDVRRAQAAIDTVARTIASLPFVDARRQFQTELTFTLATGPVRDQRERAYAMLDSVVTFYAPGGSNAPPNASKLVPALVARGRAALALGRPDAAEIDLTRAAELYDAQRASIASLPQRATLLASARSVFESLVSVRLAQGRTRDALDALERSRLAFATRSTSIRDSVRFTASPGEVILDYLMLGDTVVTWVIDTSGVTVARSVAGAAVVTAAVERLKVGFQLHAPDTVLHAILDDLYRRLLMPNEVRLRSEQRLTIIADGPLGDVPFAALRDPRTGTYVLERHSVRFAATLRDAAAVATPVRGPVRALFVAEPQRDTGAFASLPPLPYAEAETRASAAAYTVATRLTGSAADSATIVTALPHTTVFHFAGHALFDDARPERSRLVVRPRGLDANAIASLDLDAVRLVVLSACESMRTSEHRGTGFAGLAEAFLATGAGGVVGSVWPVDDEATAELMRAFHERYSRTSDAAASLQQAQVALLHGPTAALRSPWAWGAFRYAGM